MPADEVFGDCYKKTSYRACLGKSYLDFRVDQRSGKKSWFAKSQWVTSWAFISAENPHSILFTDRRNKARSGRLLRHLQARNMKYLLGLGVPDSDDWPVELGFFVLNISANEARRIGRKFSQHAIVFFICLKPIRLIWLA